MIEGLLFQEVPDHERGLISIQNRHLEVQDDHLVDLLTVLHFLLDHLKSLVPRMHHVNLDIKLLKHTFHRDLLDHVVVRDEHLPLVVGLNRRK